MPVEQQIYKQLLAIATQNSDNSSSPSIPSSSGDNIPNRAFLENCISDVSRRSDPAFQLNQTLDALAASVENFKTDANEANAADISSQLELLDDLIGGFADLTPQFLNRGGVQMLEDLMDTRSNPSIQRAACGALKSLTENNPVAQKSLVDGGFLDRLLERTENPDQDERLREQCVGLLCSIVRSTESDFANSHVATRLARLLDAGNSQKTPRRVALRVVRTLAMLAFSRVDQASTSTTLNSAASSAFCDLLERFSPFGSSEDTAAAETANYAADVLANHVDPKSVEEDVRRRLATVARGQLLQLESPEAKTVFESLIRRFEQ